MEFKELRIASGMNMKQFSEYFNIPYRTIQNWENEVRKCPEYLMELMQYKLKKEGLIQAGSSKSAIKEICEKHNKTQIDLSEMLSIPLATVQSWYTGQCEPPEYIVDAIKDALQTEKERWEIVKKTSYK